MYMNLNSVFRGRKGGASLLIMAKNSQVNLEHVYFGDVVFIGNLNDVCGSLSLKLNPLCMRSL